MARTVDPESIQFFSGDVIDWRTYIVAYLENRVVGVVSLVEETKCYLNSVGVGFISTHIDYRNQGVAKALVEALFAFAALRGKNLANTAYEPLGELYLERVMQRTALQYPDVVLYERNY